MLLILNISKTLQKITLDTNFKYQGVETGRKKIHDHLGHLPDDEN